MKLLLDVREDAVVVPLKAVTIEKGGAYIYVMRKDSTVEKRFIELGPEFGNKVVVERGLAQGEMIVVEGFHKLNPGMKVRVVEADKAEEVDNCYKGVNNESQFFYRSSGFLGGHIHCNYNNRSHRVDYASGGSVSADNSAGG